MEISIIELQYHNSLGIKILNIDSPTLNRSLLGIELSKTKIIINILFLNIVIY